MEGGRFQMPRITPRPVSCQIIADAKVEFREDLKKLLEKAAVGGKPVTFLFNDNQVWLHIKFKDEADQNVNHPGGAN